MADGNIGHTSTNRHKQTQHQPLGAQGSAAHRNFNGAKSGGGEARSRPDRSEGFAAVLSAGNMEGQLGLELQAIRARSGRPRELLSSRRSSGGALGARTGSGHDEFVGKEVHQHRVREKEKERVGQWSGFYHEWRRRRASTSAGDTGRQAAKEVYKFSKD